MCFLNPHPEKETPWESETHILYIFTVRNCLKGCLTFLSLSGGIGTHATCIHQESLSSHSYGAKLSIFPGPTNVGEGGGIGSSDAHVGSMGRMVYLPIHEGYQWLIFMGSIN